MKTLARVCIKSTKKTFLHFLFPQEGPFVYFSLTGGVNNSNHILAELCEYR